ncbi:MAG: metal-sensitive transcriptional regulator [Actinomycetota bacterium]|nr:metal-sensitive transcriptional regulator [Actinomycetota bacterium]
MRGYTGNKDDYLSGLSRVEDEVRGLRQMIDDGSYCIEVLTRISAATAALREVSLGLVDEHLKHCVADAIADGGDSGADKVREATDAIARLVKS